MTKGDKRKFLTGIIAGQKKLSSLSKKERTTLEESWDVEHAYYSSALEGSQLDRDEFEKLAEN